MFIHRTNVGSITNQQIHQSTEIEFSISDSFLDFGQPISIFMNEPKTIKMTEIYFKENTAV